MAYDRQFLRITWGFTVTNSTEVANTSLAYSSAAGWSGAAAALAEVPEEDLVELYAAYGVTLMGASNTAWANFSQLRSVKLAAVGVDGHYLADPKLYETSGTPTAGSEGGVLPQATIALGLRSGQTLGSGNYGRMYLPHTMLGLPSGDPRGTASAALELAQAGADFLNEVTEFFNDRLTAVVFPVIMSQEGIVSKGVTSVAVGRVNDTQRRRRNALDEDYQFAPLA